MENTVYSSFLSLTVENTNTIINRIKYIRSNFNSRGVNSRELWRVFGHSSESSGAFLTKIGGNVPTDLPDLPKPTRTSKNLRKTKFLEKKFLKNRKNFNDYF